MLEFWSVLLSLTYEHIEKANITQHLDSCDGKLFLQWGMVESCVSAQIPNWGELVATPPRLDCKKYLTMHFIGISRIILSAIAIFLSDCYIFSQGHSLYFFCHFC